MTQSCRLKQIWRMCELRARQSLPSAETKRRLQEGSVRRPPRRVLPTWKPRLQCLCSRADVHLMKQTASARTSGKLNRGRLQLQRSMRRARTGCNAINLPLLAAAIYMSWQLRKVHFMVLNALQRLGRERAAECSRMLAEADKARSTAAEAAATREAELQQQLQHAAHALESAQQARSHGLHVTSSSSYCYTGPACTAWSCMSFPLICRSTTGGCQRSGRIAWRQRGLQMMLTAPPAHLRRRPRSMQCGLRSCRPAASGSSQGSRCTRAPSMQKWLLRPCLSPCFTHHQPCWTLCAGPREVTG